MFGNHTGRGGHGRGPRHGGGRPDGADGFRGGRGRARMFEHGDLKLVVLHLLATRPRHGYEIIKAIEELAGGDYSPSPGVVYPTLTLLEELGHITNLPEQDGKKQFAISAQGRAYLETQREALTRILGRMASAGSIADARRAPELQRAMENFKMALHFRLGRGALETDALRRIADAIDRAAVEIERS